MDRNKMLQQLTQQNDWDIIIIGGGATGLGTAVDAASRGYKTLLVEQNDFAKGTSSRSTKLVHGGVRYLAQGNIKLVKEALKERGLLLKNAPHISHSLSFVIPCFSWWQKMYYFIGLSMYDMLARKLGLGKTKIISQKKSKEILPTITSKKLSGAIAYKDGQFDDARLAINLAQTAVDNGAVVINYCKVLKLLKEDNIICGVIIEDQISKQQYTQKAKVVINATGVFVDDILKLDNPSAENIVSPSQGIHLVINKKYLQSATAIMIPKTEDGRVLFAVPWHHQIIVGTTDTPIPANCLEPKPIDEEVAFILHHLNKYLNINISKADVDSVYVGLRPLVKKGEGNKTSLMPRDHVIIVSATNLITVTGGKWTTYRKMADDVLTKAILVGNLSPKKCVTEHLNIHGYTNEISIDDSLKYYGSDAILINNLCKQNGELKEPIHPNFSNIKAEIIWAVQNEMAINIEDVLARRTRILFLDAKAAMQAAPMVAKLMADEMNKDDIWQQQQINDFTTLAKQYVLS